MSVGIADTANKGCDAPAAAARPRARAARTACVAACVCALHAGLVPMLAGRPFVRGEPAPVRVVSAELLVTTPAAHAALSAPPADRRLERASPHLPQARPAKQPAVPEQPAPAKRAATIAPPSARPVESAAAPGAPSPSALGAQSDAAAVSTATASPAPSIATPAVPKSVARLDCAIVEPGYPALSRRLRETGTAVIELEVDAAGRVASARVAASSGYPRLDDAARNAVSASRCAPYLENGTARPARANVPMTFNLTDQ